MAFVTNKVSVVTGGAGGIGSAIVEHLLKNGARGVGIVDLSEENGKAVEKKFKDTYGDKVIFIKTDVTKEKELREALERTIEKFGNLDILVNNAGMLDEKNWRKIISVNLEALLLGTYLVLDEYFPKPFWKLY
ncbi:hypothetical protein JTB14_003688 [Gonioctena quinquepunctata]|nr:hypothetical protein JTB14_003688 [Gonioctena quinquepunctata]